MMKNEPLYNTALHQTAKSGDKSMFDISAKGLKEAAEALAGVVPTAVGIVKQIVDVLRV